MKRILSLFVVFALVLGAVGCSSAGGNTKRGAKWGAAFGAILGAATAVATGKSPEEVLKRAAIGAAAGAAIGAGIGHIQDKKIAERSAAVERYAYNSSQGYVVQVEKVALSDTSPAPGQQVVATVTYTAISPNYKETISIAGIPVVRSGKEAVELGNFKSEVVNGGGTMEVSIPITLSKSFPKGSYTLETRLSVGSATGTGSTSFYIG